MIINSMPQSSGTPIGLLPIGEVIPIRIGGEIKNFVVAHQGKPSDLYADSCSGTWILMKDIYTKDMWRASALISGMNNYEASTIHTYLNKDFYSLIDQEIRSQIKTVKIPYRAGGGMGTTISNGEDGLECKVFLLSTYEAGFIKSEVDTNYLKITTEGSRLSYFLYGNDDEARKKRICTFGNEGAIRYFLRSLNLFSDLNAATIETDGGIGGTACNNTMGIRPVFILPNNYIV